MARIESGLLRMARYLTLIAVPLAMLVSAGGIFLPALYKDPAEWFRRRGQDVVTLLTCPLLLLALAAAQRGSGAC